MRKNITQEEAAGEIRKGMGKFSEKDLENVVNKEEKLKWKFLKEVPLKTFFEDFLILFALVTATIAQSLGGLLQQLALLYYMY